MTPEDRRRADAMTPDAALLEEADEWIGDWTLEGSEVIGRLASALRAALDRERQVAEWLKDPNVVYTWMLRGDMARNILDRAEKAERERDALTGPV